MSVHHDPRAWPDKLSGNSATYIRIGVTNADYAMNSIRVLITKDFADAAGWWTTMPGGALQWRSAGAPTSYCLTIRAAW